MQENSRVSLPSCDCLPISNEQFDKKKRKERERERRTLCVHSHQYIEKILSGTHSYRNYIIDSITTRGLWDHVFFMQQQIIAIVFLAGARITVGVFLT